MNETAPSWGGGGRLELDFGDSDRDDSMVELTGSTMNMTHRGNVRGETSVANASEGDGSCGERAAE